MPASGSNRVSAAYLIAVVIVISGRTTAAREAEYEVTIQTNVMVRMRDGVRLATDVYLPAKDAKPIDAKLKGLTIWICPMPQKLIRSRANR